MGLAASTDAPLGAVPGAFSPQTRARVAWILLEAGDQLVVGVDQRLLGFDLGDDGLLGGEGREVDWHLGVLREHCCYVPLVFGGFDQPSGIRGNAGC